MVWIPGRSRRAMRTALWTIIIMSAALPAASSKVAFAETTQHVSPACSGWSSTPPSECGMNTGRTSVTANYNNDIGCDGYYDGPGEMHCRAVARTAHNIPVAVRTGFWDGSNGFGWSKAYYYHNLWMQPMLDTITYAATPRGSNSSRDYEVYHYNPDGYVDQEVIVVADIQDDDFQGQSTIDHKPVGVITGYCLTPGGAEEPECPDWVDSGPEEL